MISIPKTIPPCTIPLCPGARSIEYQEGFAAGWASATHAHGSPGGKVKSKAKTRACRMNPRKPDDELTAQGWYRRAQVLDRQGKRNLAKEARKIAAGMCGGGNESGHPAKACKEIAK